MNDRFKQSSKNINIKRKIPTIPDERIAALYISKIATCTDRNIPFCLSLQSFINLYRAKKCFYTGLPLNSNTISIDRIDSNKGYEKGNVVACRKEFNNFKSIMEDPCNILDYKLGFKGMNKLMKQLKIKEK